jgi:hypothetical protein
MAGPDNTSEINTLRKGMRYLLLFGLTTGCHRGAWELRIISASVLGSYPALNDREIALDGVGVVVVPDIFLGRVVLDTMVGVEGANNAIDGRLVALKTAVCISSSK